MRTWYAMVGVVVVVLAGCGRPKRSTSGTPAASPPGVSLREARRGFVTKLAPTEATKEPVDAPPPGVFRLTHYDAPPGKLAAYVSPDPGDGKRHPAIVWIAGGDCNSIGDVWSPAPADNDQTASAYRKAGVVTMFPSLRGGNDNPGAKEGFLGEVEDVMAAADALAKEPYVDPARIYLGGHSTGGTLALLVAETTDRFRAVFAFGPVADPAGYGDKPVYVEPGDAREATLRAPGNWLGSIRSPTFVIEGTTRGNIEALNAMAKSSTNPNVHFLRAFGESHFSVLAPTNALLARKILADQGPTTNLDLTGPELQKVLIH